MRRVIFALALSVFATPAGAHELVESGEADPYSSALLQCMDSARSDAAALRACKDTAAAPCIEALGTTNGMVLCISNETAIWEELIESHLQRLNTVSPENAEQLAAAQRAWRSYSQMQCGYRVALWGEGTGARVELASCYEDMAVERAITLALIPDP